jgi:predicted component of type VI protein secretion system
MDLSEFESLLDSPTMSESPKVKKQTQIKVNVAKKKDAEPDWNEFVKSMEEVIKTTKFIVPAKKWKAGKSLRPDKRRKVSTSAHPRALASKIEDLAESLQRRHLITVKSCSDILNSVDALIKDMLSNTTKKPNIIETTFETLNKIYQTLYDLERKK